MKILTQSIKECLEIEFNIKINSTEYFSMLVSEGRIVIVKDKYYLKEYYDAEINIVKRLNEINKKNDFNKDLSKYIKKLESSFNITYNDEQKESIVSIFYNNLVIITGGPGTGKTTIINGILNLYKRVKKLSDDEPR